MALRKGFKQLIAEAERREELGDLLRAARVRPADPAQELVRRVVGRVHEHVADQEVEGLPGWWALGEDPEWSVQPAEGVLDGLRLHEHGLELINPDPYLFAPLPDGRSVTFSRDTDATARSIAAFSSEDARRYSEFRATLDRIRSFAGRVMSETPPDIEQPTGGDLWSMLMLGRRFRGLGQKDAYRALRWAPMSAADFVSEWFESEPLRCWLKSTTTSVHVGEQFNVALTCAVGETGTIASGAARWCRRRPSALLATCTALITGLPNMRRTATSRSGEPFTPPRVHGDCG